MSVLVREGGPQVKKIEQVSSYGHQVSLTGVRPEIGVVPCLTWGGGGAAWVWEGGLCLVSRAGWGALQ